MTEPPPAPYPDWRDQVAGSLLLSACGDALGAPFEGQPRVDPGELDWWLDEPADPLRWTDDTAQTLVLAGHLADQGGTVDQDTLAMALASEWLREPGRGYGAGAARVLAAITDGERWSRAAAGAFHGTGSFGNGAAMRVAPVGLLAGRGLAAVAEWARRTASVTHAHPLGQDGAVVQALAVATARQLTDAPADEYPERFLTPVTEHARTPEFRAALRRVTTLVGWGTAPAQVASQLGNDVTALGSVPAACTAFLSHPADARAALRYAIRVGGDTDTIAAMTGALCGARLGQAAVPRRWVRRLEAMERISATASRLAGLSSPQRYGFEIGPGE